jgi:hypothetical protein
VLRSMKRATALGSAVAVTGVVAVCGLAAPAAASPLPDGRGYELVSPPDKNGGDVMAYSSRTRVEAGEAPGLPMAATFASLAAFGDAQGTGVATDYMSVRTAEAGTRGWRTHALSPLQQPVNFLAQVAAGVGDPLFVGDFSPELTHAAYRSWSPLTDAPNVKDAPNLYVREDLRSSGSGAYQLASDAFAPLGVSLAKPWFAGASQDFSHVIFESDASLTPEVPPCSTDLSGGGCPEHLYESIDGTVYLAGILPDGSAAAVSLAGQGASSALFTPHVISADGSKVFFTDPTSGSSGRDGALYMRVDTGTPGAATVQLNASEKTNGSGPGNTDVNGPQPALFWDASVSGSRVFFVSAEALTNDAPEDGAGKLYVYDTTKPAGDANLTLVSVDHQPSDGAGVGAGGNAGVIGTSADGHYVYFIAVGQLVAGAPVLGTGRGLYVWHDESGTAQTDYIGQITDSGTDFGFDLPGSYALGGAMNGRVTPDGLHLLFSANSGVGLLSADGGTDYDQQSGCTDTPNFDGFPGCNELYVYSVHAERDGHHLHCASCRPDGTPATTDAATMVSVGTGATQIVGHISHALSDDGRWVFFDTAEALVPQDTNGKQDAYEYDTTTQTVHLLSSGKDAADSHFMDASADGRDAFIVTRQRLVGWDQDGNYDLYDVRVGGGFPDPVPAPVPCAGDTCQGASPAAPAGSTVGSLTFRGRGNVPAVRARRHRALRCRRGFVRKRVHRRLRCVKRRRHRAARRASRAAVFAERGRR